MRHLLIAFPLFFFVPAIGRSQETADSFSLSGVGVGQDLMDQEPQARFLSTGFLSGCDCGLELGGDTCQKSGCGTADCGNAGLYAGCSLMFAKPHLKESFKAFAVDLPTGPQNLIGFSHSYDLAPRVWLGYQGQDGLGVRTRYWQYDQTADPLTLVSGPASVVAAQSITVVFPAVITSTGPDQTLTVGNGLQTQTLDLEGTQRLTLGSVDGVVGMGLRYASLRQSFQATITAPALPQQFLATEREFEGFGPMLSGEFRRPLGASGLNAFAGVGGGIFFGTKSMQRQVSSLPPSFPPVVSMDQVDEVTGMGELRVGLEWSRCTSLGRLFARGDYEAQLWTDAGAPTLTFLGFEGLGLSVGIQR